MTDLSHLAGMVPEVAEYISATRQLRPGNGWTKADAALLACQAKVLELEEELRDLTVEHLSSGPWCEVCGRVTNEANDAAHPGRCNACAKVEELEAENEALKCCGNCGLFEIDWDGLETTCPGYTKGTWMRCYHTDHCHFTPSRWQRRQP